MSDQLQLAADRIRLWRHEPDTMVRDLFGVEPDTWQVAALRAFADPSRPRISMQACAGPGKSAVESWMGWNFQLCHADAGKHPNGFAVSVTSDNLKTGLWKEFGVWYNRSDLLQRCFELTAEKIASREHPRTWWLAARSYSKTADPESQGRTLSGLHAPFIAYFLDESGDMPTSLVRTAEQGLSNCEWGKIVQAGNTTSQTGCLYLAATTQRHLWHVIAITADPDRADRTPRVSIEWAREQINLYGRENPWVQAYILGEFPSGGINQLLSVEEVTAAMGRHLRDEDFSWAQKRVGIDVARFGDDRSVIFPRQGLASFAPTVMRGMRTTDIAARVMVAKRDWNWEMALVDDTGHWGHGVIDNLISMGAPATPVMFHARQTFDPRYFNRRAEMWMEMAEWVKRGGALPNVPELVAELTEPTYGFREGKLVLEDKEHVKARLGRSPDLADALALTFAVPDMPSNPSLPLGFSLGGMVSESWDADRPSQQSRGVHAGMASESWS